MDILIRQMHNFGLVGVGIFVVFASLNALFFVRNLIKHDRHVSMIPLIGGVSGFLGCLATPSLRYYAVAPLILDIGTFTFLANLPSLLKEMWQISRYNLVREYVGSTDRKKVHLRLFRRDIVTVIQALELKPGELGVSGSSSIGEWSQTNDELRLRINGAVIVYRIADENGQAVLHQTAGFAALDVVQFRLKYSATQTPSTDM